MRLFIFLAVYLILNAYIGWNVSSLLLRNSSVVGSALFWGILALVAFSYILGRLKVLKGPIGRFLKVIGSFYIALFEFLLILLPIGDVVGWILIQMGAPYWNVVSWAGLIICVLLILLIAVGSWNAWTPIRRTYHLTIQKRVAGLTELRVAVASDIHLGNIVGNRHLTRLVKEMKDIAPDLILFPGDVIDDDIEPFERNQMKRHLAELHARFGIFAVLGNHEYYGGHIEAYAKQMQSIGIPVLQDEVVLVDELFYVVGRKDKTAQSMDPAGRQSIEDLLQPVDKERPVIVMDHQPYQFDRASKAGVDVLLCGHTHRGQFAPNHFVTKRLFELDWGYMLKEKMHVVVSSGFGTWGPPVRLASRSEVILLVIQFQ